MLPRTETIQPTEDQPKLPTEQGKPPGASRKTFEHSHHGEEGESRMASMRKTLLLAGLSLGVIYGDIGTSTMYCMNGIFPAAGKVPSEEDVIGAVSAILWAITIVPVIKYCLISLQFATGEGEGGPFAVFVSMYPPKENKGENRALTSYTTASASPSSTNATAFLQRPIVKGILLVTTLFAVTLTISDGLLTPAVSVSSAVVGISVPFPSVSNKVVGISIAILVVLFLLQMAGTRRVGYLFSPILFVWFILNAVSGCINIASHPGIFRALDPSRAVMLFVRTKDYDILSGVILSLTGAEALFANLGQFSTGSIRFAFICFIYPCLILAYLGQGARLIVDGANVLPNIFFQSIPGGVGGGYWWVTWVFAILAAIIASQAMITATFSLVQQLTTLHVMPPVKVVHTDDESSHRIYVPAVNFLLLIGCIGLVGGFGTDVGLTNAYGFAVSGVFIITTIMLSLAMIQIKHLPIAVAVVYFFASGFIDCLFFGATLRKVPHGAWFPLGLACVLLSFLLAWAWAKKLEDKFDEGHRYRLTEVMRRAATRHPDAPEDLKNAASATEEAAASEGASAPGKHDRIRILAQQARPRPPDYDGMELEATSGAFLARLPVFAIFHNSSAPSYNGAPHSFSAFLRSYPSLPQVIVFLTVRTVGVPHVSDEDRYLVDRVRTFEGLYICTMRFGYRDAKDLSNVAVPLRERIVALEARSNPEGLEARVQKIDAAIDTSVTHILPNFYVLADPSPRRPKIVRYVRQFLIEEIYRRVKVNFDEYEQYRFGDEEDVLRMSVNALL
ncbi:hypothetical protein JCM5296_000623 [Sporobolomyces johnsonii]